MDIIIAGADVVGLLVLQIIDDINKYSPGKYKILGFIDDNKSDWHTDLYGYKVLGNSSVLGKITAKNDKKISVVCPIGSPVNRYKMVEKCRKYKILFPNIIHPSAQVSEYASIGNGNIFQQNVVIQPDAVIGNFNKFNISAIMGPRSYVGSYCTVNALTMIASGGRLKDFCYIGMGAKVMNKVTLSDGTVVGANAFVHKDTQRWSTVVGVPAREIKIRKNPLLKK